MADDLPFWIALQSVREIGPKTFNRLLDRFGDPKTVLLKAKKRELAALPRLNKAAIQRITTARGQLGRAERVIAGLRRRGVDAVTLRDPSYPPELKSLENPPPILYVLGALTRADRNGVAIVGATTPSRKGYEIAKESARRIASTGTTIVSGYARGVDTAGHLGALEVGGRTVMALPTGINHFRLRPGFPPLESIRENAAVISEAFPDSEWTTVNAILRNRLVVALSRAVFIVETRDVGGTMNTFATAQKQGKKVFVLKYQHPPQTASGNDIAIERGGIPISSYSHLKGILAV